MGLRDEDTVWHPQPFIVRREATFNEWLEYCRSMGIILPDHEVAQARAAYFYEISTD